MDISLWIVGVALVGVAWVLKKSGLVRGILIRQNFFKPLQQHLLLLVSDG